MDPITIGLFIAGVRVGKIACYEIGRWYGKRCESNKPKSQSVSTGTASTSQSATPQR